MIYGTSLVTRWIRILLPTQGTQVQPLVQEDSTYRTAAKPSTTMTESMLLSLQAATPEASVPGACAPQQEKLLQREVHALQRRVASTRRN